MGGMHARPCFRSVCKLSIMFVLPYNIKPLSQLHNPQRYLVLEFHRSTNNKRKKKQKSARWTKVKLKSILHGNRMWLLVAATLQWNNNRNNDACHCIKPVNQESEMKNEWKSNYEQNKCGGGNAATKSNDNKNTTPKTSPACNQNNQWSRFHPHFLHGCITTFLSLLSPNSAISNHAISVSMRNSAFNRIVYVLEVWYYKLRGVKLRKKRAAHNRLDLVLFPRSMFLLLFWCWWFVVVLVVISHFLPSAVSLSFFSIILREWFGSSLHSWLCGSWLLSLFAYFLDVTVHRWLLLVLRLVLFVDVFFHLLLSQCCCVVFVCLFCIQLVIAFLF